MSKRMRAKRKEIKLNIGDRATILRKGQVVTVKVFNTDRALNEYLVHRDKDGCNAVFWVPADRLREVEK